MSETTDANPSAANGSRNRWAIGVAMAPTIEQATRAPIGALPPADRDSEPARRVGQHADRHRDRQEPPGHGEERSVRGDSDARSRNVIDERDVREVAGRRQARATHRQAHEQARADRKNDQVCVNDARRPERDPRP